MRRQEYAAIGLIVALILIAWYFEHAKEQSRVDARAADQTQQAGAR